MPTPDDLAEFVESIAGDLERASQAEFTGDRDAHRDAVGTATNKVEALFVGAPQTIPGVLDDVARRPGVRTSDLAAVRTGVTARYPEANTTVLQRDIAGVIAAAAERHGVDTATVTALATLTYNDHGTATRPHGLDIPHAVADLAKPATVEHAAAYRDVLAAVDEARAAWLARMTELATRSRSAGERLSVDEAVSRLVGEDRFLAEEMLAAIPSHWTARG